jgi:IS30 family transposase
MAYIQLTYEERVTLSALKLQCLSIREIAKMLGRHFSTLYRELKRNRCQVTDGAYRPSKAQQRTRARRGRSRRNSHYSRKDFLLIRKLLRQKWSPEQIVGHLRRFKLMARRISHETIYQYIWNDKARGGALWK